MKKKQKNLSALSQKCLQCFQVTNSKNRICVRCQLKSNLKILISIKLLSPELFPQICQYLEIPNEIGKLSFRQVKKVERILHQIKNKSFNFNLLKANQTSSLSTEVQTNPETIEPTLQIKKVSRSNRRKSATPEIVRILQTREQNKCYWCGCKVVRISDVPMQNRLELKGGYSLVYWNEEEIQEAAIATVDHLVRFADGGSLKPDNTVLSCFKCNNERNLETQKQLLEQRTCFFCGKKYNDLKNLRCTTCLAGFGLTELISKETEINPQDKKKSVWQRIKEFLTYLLK